jgi:hypothetical protein
MPAAWETGPRECSLHCGICHECNSYFHFPSLLGLARCDVLPFHNQVKSLCVSIRPFLCAKQRRLSKTAVDEVNQMNTWGKDFDVTFLPRFHLVRPILVISTWYFACCLFIIPMIGAVFASETSIYFNETTRRYIPEGYHLRTPRPKNLKSHQTFSFCLTFYMHQKPCFTYRLWLFRSEVWSILWNKRTLSSLRTKTA